MSGGRHGRAAITAGAAALLVAICGGAAASGATDGDQQDAAAERPNIVVIVTDDQDTGSFTRKLMPKTFGLMDGGTRLTNFTIATPLCCPSRAAAADRPGQQSGVAMVKFVSRVPPSHQSERLRHQLAGEAAVSWSSVTITTMFGRSVAASC